MSIATHERFGFIGIPPRGRYNRTARAVNPHIMEPSDHGPGIMGGTRFSREAWDRNAAIYETIRTMPFNAQLASGSLSEAQFKNYITQDAHYLVGFGRALTLAAAKAPDPDRIVQFAKAAEGALVVERAL